jgi:uncharacterized protein
MRAFHTVALCLALAVPLLGTSARPSPARASAAAHHGAADHGRAFAHLANVTAQDSSFHVPRRIGQVNDYAGVVPDSTRGMLEEALRQVGAITGGEITLVTLPTLSGADVSTIAKRIANTWGVGASPGAARRAGALVLLVPKETSSDGRGYCRIELSNDASAFIPDSVATTICVASVPAFRERNYGEGLRMIAVELTRRYTAQFNGSR